MKYKIDIRKLNEGEFTYLKEVFSDFDGEDFDSFYAYLSYLEDAEVDLYHYTDINEFSSFIIRIINDVHEDYDNIELNYVEEKKKKTIILDVNLLNSQGHKYLKELLDFPDYYGKNLDALYDCLSEIDDLQIVIINMDEVNRRSLKILAVFDEVAEEYDNLHITYEDEEEKDEAIENGFC